LYTWTLDLVEGIAVVAVCTTGQVPVGTLCVASVCVCVHARAHACMRARACAYARGHAFI